MTSLKRCFLAGILLWLPSPLHAQVEPEPDRERDVRMARRGGGIRGGIWKAENPAGETEFKRSPSIEGYFQRGLDQHLALESSAGVWRRSSSVTQPLSGNVVETHTYVVPIMTALKFFPFTKADDRLQPFVLGGLGFALGVEDEAENAIGGGGTSIVAGFGFKGAGGLELQLSDSFGLTAGARYQYVRFGEDLGVADTFKGVGFEGGITYRFQF